MKANEPLTANISPEIAELMRAVPEPRVILAPPRKRASRSAGTAELAASLASVRYDVRMLYELLSKRACMHHDAGRHAESRECNSICDIVERYLPEKRN